MPGCACGCGQEATREGLSDRCFHLLAGACLGKKRWSAAQARKVAALPTIRGKEAYACPVCGQHHVGTSLGAAGQRINAEREAIVSRMRRNGNGAHLTKLTGYFESADRRRWKAREWKRDHS